jgi:cellulose synthase/poly-beta-1,6-N-acetylglucosamine synthase-like glycosyltransferase
MSERGWSCAALVATVAICLSAGAHYAWRGSGNSLAIDLASLLLALPLLYGSLVYQLCRLGALRRDSVHAPPKLADLEKIYTSTPPSLQVLIPSYKEEPHVLRQTLLSAALAEYPSKEIVVLIDDPPQDRICRDSSWRVVEEVATLLEKPRRRFQDELVLFRTRQAAGHIDVAAEVQRIAGLFRDLATWLEQTALFLEAECRRPVSHSDQFFFDRILRDPASAHRLRAAELVEQSHAPETIEQSYLRLSSLLDARITGFERKLYENLSHAPNKAMNLNAYIGLFGRNLRDIQANGRRRLVDCQFDVADFRISRPDFVLTLDADSVLQSDYVLRLIEVMAKDQTVAVAQTPYSAFPEAPGTLEKTAGATTDIQYLCHQGSTEYGAAYWVGANALLRVTALEDIRQNGRERDHPVPIFIQDKTVIEDTGSTVDLVARGWKIYNYPDRLAFSATPPDFGALIIQRRRWANGGLIILPDLLKLPHLSWAERLVRVHYLVSPALGSLSVLALMLVSLDAQLLALWLPLVSAPYFILYGRDLVRCGYRWGDLFRVYALNLLLMPVNLAGVGLSVIQLLSGRKTPFGRTPKVHNRTGVPARYILFNLLVLAAMLGSGSYAIAIGDVAHAPFPLMSAGVYLYGMGRMIGWEAMREDVLLAFRERLTYRLANIAEIEPMRDADAEAA